MDLPRDSSPPPSSPGDTIDEDSKPAHAEVDGAIGAEPEVDEVTQLQKKSSSRTKRRSTSAKSKVIEAPTDGNDEETGAEKTAGAKAPANGTVGSVYSGTKVRHIKKEDGTPLWRKEIQYDFLRLVIGNKEPVFTRFSDKKPGCNFADIYIDCLVHSSKTSKVLKDRLLKDREAGENMAMICLLVNVGRMNTTLNFFPEMRAQLRTYHSIPSLQAYKSQKDYKSLQDAPRLKSILKGASEDDETQPKSLKELEGAKPPARANAVHCIFILSNNASRVSEEHFLDKVDWFDLAMRPTISSKSRAQAFLWIMWWYLEAQWSKQNALNNPFGPGTWDPADDRTRCFPAIVPMEYITEEEAEKENVDTPEEIEFAEAMTKQRKEILERVANEPALTMADPGNPENKSVKRLRVKKSLPAFDEDTSIAMSDVDSRASPGIGKSPAPVENATAMSSATGVQADSIDDDFEMHEPHPGRGRYKRVRGKNTPSRSKATPTAAGASKRRIGTPDVRSTPQPPIGGQVIMNQYGVPKAELTVPAAASKPRARTGYQRELEEHKQKRVEWALRRKRKDLLAQTIQRPTNFILSTARRVQDLEPTFDSEEEMEGVSSTALGGLTARVFFSDPREMGRERPRQYDKEDWGAESEGWLRAVKRVRRRMEVWDGDRDLKIRHALSSRGLKGRFPPVDGLDLMSTPPVRNRSDTRSKKEMDAQIELDLLAEHSDNDEDMDDGYAVPDDADRMEAEAEEIEGESDVPMD